MPASKLEQLLVELVNGARLDPVGNAARYITGYSPLSSSDSDIRNALGFFQVSGVALQTAFNSLAPVEPLAWNETLATAARAHSQLMLARDTQSHQLPGEPDLGARIGAAGYDLSFAGENIYAFSRSAIHAHAAFMVDWGLGPNGMQNPAGHRNNIMNDGFRELGIGVIQDASNANQVGPLLVTQDFGNRFALASDAIILGVAYDDTLVNDDFYSLDEGVGGLHVALGATVTDTAVSGGYSLSTVATGLQTLTFSGGGLTGSITVTASLAAGHNYKFDVVDPGGASPVLQTSASATVGGAAAIIKGLGTTGLALAGGPGSQTLIGTRANDTLSGGAGADTLEGGGGNDTYLYDTGDSLAEAANAGNDTVRAAVTVTLPVNVENLVLLPGSGAIDGSGNGVANALTGNESANRLAGGAGNDTLTGGDGADAFVYAAGGGADRVTDFSSAQGDVVDLTAFGTIHSLAQLLASAAVTDTAAGVRVAFSASDTLTLAGVTLASLADADFSFRTVGAGPDGVALTGGTVEENAPVGTVVGVLSTSDPDPGDSFAYRLLNNAGGRFSVNGATLAVRGAIDFEAATSHHVTVRVTDSGGNTFDQLLTIAVTDVGGQTITGSEGNDLVSASSTVLGQPPPTGEEDVIRGLGGDDSLNGLGGNDTIEGGLGDDLLFGGGTVAVPGSDTVSYESAAAAVRVSLALATAQATGGAGRDTLAGFENLTGSGFDDVLTGSAMANVIAGGNGNDTIQGSAGADALDGGAGIDTASYAASALGVVVDLAVALQAVLNGSAANGDAAGDSLVGFENLIGSGRADRLTGDAGANVIEGGAGNDTLVGAGGTDTVSYAAAAVGVTVSLASGTATGGAGRDTFQGFENVFGGRGADSLAGDGLANVVLGGAGNDTISGGAGADTLDGGAGLNTLSYAEDTIGVAVSLAGVATGGNAQDDSISHFANLLGGSGNDALRGGFVSLGSAAVDNNRIEGGNGNDTIEGGYGDDLLFGGGTVAVPGSDTVSYESAAAAVRVSLAMATAQATGGAGRDTLAGFENLTGSGFDDVLTGSAMANVIAGGNGNDTIQGSAGADALNGGAGIDTASYAASALGVVVDLAVALQAVLNGSAANGDAAGDSLVGFENLIGSGRADRLTGDAGANVIEGGAGNDTLVGGPGNDTLGGGTGDDVYVIDDGGDIVNELAAAGADRVDCRLDQYVLGANVEGLRYAGGGDFTGTGNAGPNALTGGAGNDTLDGAGGNDSLIGAGGGDVLSGGAGSDLLIGGLGNDRLTGGAGADRFRFDTLPDATANLDTISDFSVVDDTIQFENAIFSSLATAGALAAGSFRSGAGLTSAVDANDYLIYDRTSGALYYDAGGNTGDGAVQIALLGVGLALTAADFVVI